MEADFAPIPELEGRATTRAGRFQAESLEAQEVFDAAVGRAESGDEEAAIQEFIRAACIAETAHEWYLVAMACQRVGDFLMTEPPPHDLERAFRMYRRAVAAYDQCGLFAEARELAYRHMCAKLRRSAELGLSWTKRVELLLHWAVAGFGYRPLRVVLSAGLIVLGFALVYFFTGGVVRSTGSEALSFPDAVYFSGITFATVGFGDFIPMPALRMVALSEGFLGALTMGLFVAVLANRLSKA